MQKQLYVLIVQGKIASRLSQKIYDAGDIDGSIKHIDAAKGFLEKSTKNKND